MEKNKSITAVEWLIDQLEGDDSKIARVIGLKKYNSLIQKAKEMDVHQKREFFEQGYKSGITDYIDIQKVYDGRAIGFEKYYNEEYGGNK